MVIVRLMEMEVNYASNPNLGFAFKNLKPKGVRQPIHGILKNATRVLSKNDQHGEAGKVETTTRVTIDDKEITLAIPAINISRKRCLLSMSGSLLGVLIAMCSDTRLRHAQSRSRLKGRML